MSLNQMQIKQELQLPPGLGKTTPKQSPEHPQIPVPSPCPEPLPAAAKFPEKAIPEPGKGEAAVPQEQQTQIPREFPTPEADPRLEEKSCSEPKWEVREIPVPVPVPCAQEKQQREEFPVSIPEKQERKEIPVSIPEKQERKEFPVSIPEKQERKEFPVSIPEKQERKEFPVSVPDPVPCSQEKQECKDRIPGDPRAHPACSQEKQEFQEISEPAPCSQEKQEFQEISEPIPCSQEKQEFQEIPEQRSLPEKFPPLEQQLEQPGPWQK
uniref:Uncharacterized protein n=1 Tax=Serinus canaria TaxID=9135 RepID=A0A8C9NCG8_SERCA